MRTVLSRVFRLGSGNGHAEPARPLGGISPHRALHRNREKWVSAVTTWKLQTALQLWGGGGWGARAHVDKLRRGRRNTTVAHAHGFLSMRPHISLQQFGQKYLSRGCKKKSNPQPPDYVKFCIYTPLSCLRVISLA